MKTLLKLFVLFSVVFFNPAAYSQSVYIFFKSDSTVAKRNCDVYFSHLKNGVIAHNVYVPTNDFWSFKCPIDTSFEIILDCWKTHIVLDKIFPKCGDSIIVNLDTRTFSYLKRKQ